MNEKTDKEARVEAASTMMIAKLTEITNRDGVEAMTDEAIGMMFGIAHVFKHLGFREIHKSLRKELADYMGKP